MQSQLDVRDAGLSRARPAPAGGRVAVTGVNELPLVIARARVTRWLAGIAAVLAAIHTGMQVLRFGFGYDAVVVNRLNLEWEGSLGACFSSFLLLAAAGLLAVIAGYARQRRDAYAPYWSILALIFLGLSVDETVALHELLTEPVRDRLGVGGVLYFAWIIPGLAFVAAVGLAYARFVLNLPRPTRAGVILAGCLYVGGAVGVEMLGGLLAERGGFDNLAYAMAGTLEETLELCGLIVFIHALLGHLNRRVDHVVLRLTPRLPAA
jgi:hypothetical protein